MGLGSGSKSGSGSGSGGQTQGRHALHLQCSQCSSISGRLPCLPTESSEHQGAHCVTLASPWMPEWHASSGGEGGGGGGRGDGGGDGGDTHTAQAWHLHLVAKRRETARTDGTSETPERSPRVRMAAQSQSVAARNSRRWPAIALRGPFQRALAPDRTVLELAPRRAAGLGAVAVLALLGAALARRHGWRRRQRWRRRRRRLAEGAR